jgi:hypothetical protein
MGKATSLLSELLGELSARARAQAMTDGEWAARAGIRKETLSRLRGRNDCDLATLQALATATGARLGIDSGSATTADGHFPATLDRGAEARLLALAARPRADFDAWAASGPRFFMAGLAVMLASQRGQDRRHLLDVAERLHPGASEPGVFARWLRRSPLRPSRFLPMLDAERRHGD